MRKTNIHMAAAVCGGIMMLAFPADCFSQETNDTTAKELKEIVVEGAAQSANAQMVTYRPSSRVKNAAQDAIDLLRRMAIPQLAINPVSNSVTTPGGSEVALFINYLPARQEDIQGLRTSDVRRVEYLDYPTDPRFQGATHAVNIIVQEYEYGGYTKIYDRQFFFTDFSNYATLFSKFSYKKMAYDLYVAADNVSGHHIGNSEAATYRLPSATVTRRNDFRRSDFKYVILPVTFRAVYTSGNTQISNIVGFKFNNRYRNLREGSLLFEPSAGADYNYATDAPHTDRSIVYDGDFFFSLPQGWSLSVTPNFTYTHNNSRSTYSTTVPGEQPIVNNARENAYNMSASASLRKRFGGKHSLSFRLSGKAAVNDLEYYGSSPYDSDIKQGNFIGSCGYSLNLQKFSVSVNAGVIGEFFRPDGLKYDDWYPFGNISATYAPNGKNYISISSQYATNSPEPSERSSNVIQVNELLYRTGTPLLKDSRFSDVTLSYTCLPTNRLQLTAFAGYMGSYKRAVTCYSLFDEGNALLQSYANSGNFMEMKAGVNATVRLLNNSLIFQASPIFSHYKSTGIFSESWNPFTFSVYGQYYLGNFNIAAYYSTRTRVMDAQTGAKTTNRSYYTLQVGWANGPWNLSLHAANLFTSRYDGTWIDVNTPLYSYRDTRFNGNYKRAVALMVSYTFGYGKKIRRGDEVGRQQEAASAIME